MNEYKCLVDDGSEQDYESHIMVWQVPPPKKSKSADQMNNNNTQTTMTCTSPTSKASSDDIDLLGPSPGSGINRLMLGFLLEYIKG